MKRILFTRTLLLLLLAFALLSFAACKSDEDKCKEGDLAACQQALDKAASNMKSALDAVEKTRDVGNENSSVGILVDKRDGKKYKTVKIGNQTWMAENLKVRTEGSWCYEDKESNCQKYGRLYNWDAAKTACPAGWHLPSKGEFEALFVAVGSEDVAGKKLKSASGWKENGNGDGAFGFLALPAGFRFDSGFFNREGYRAAFWSSTEGDSYYAYNMSLDYNRDDAYLYYYNKDYGFSVRCLKD